MSFFRITSNVAIVYFLLHPMQLWAETTVSGIISADTIWTPANSPYIVTSNMLVADGATLSIAPGTEVRFMPDVSLVVSGCLDARGSSTLPITFTSSVASPSTNDLWGHIGFTNLSRDAVFDGSGNWLTGSILQNVIVQNAGGSGISGAVRVENASPFINHALIHYNAEGGIYVNGGNGIHITDSLITHNSGNEQYGGIYLNGNNTVVSNTSITYNSSTKTSSYTNGKAGGLWLYGDNVSIEKCAISNNSVTEGAGGVYVNDSNSLHFNFNNVSYNQGIDLAGGMSFGPIGGIYLNFVDSYAMEGNTFANNISGGIGVGYYTKMGSLSSLANPTSIYGNTSYAIKNAGPFGGSTLPNATGNVDARNIWWGTTNLQTINSQIIDFFDYALTGIVVYDPILLNDPTLSIWKGPGGGSYFLASNWTSNKAPNGVDAVALFTDNITTPSTITIDTDVTLGSIIFNSLQSYTVDGESAIVLQVSNGNADINVQSGTHHITVPIVLHSNAVIHGSGTLDVSGSINGNYSLSVLGTLNATSISVDTLTIGNSLATTVPEPSIVVLLLMGTFGVVARPSIMARCIRRKI